MHGCLTDTIRRFKGFSRRQADRAAWDRAQRPKVCKLVASHKLARRVAGKLKQRWSPEQIAGWLKDIHRNDEHQRVSHETIYRSLFIQARGALKKELLTHLRTQRGMRRPRSASLKGKGLDRPDPGLERVAKANGFSLHAGVSCEGKQKDKRERLCRYIARPAVAVPRLSLSSTGKVVYTLKTPYRDGTTQVAFDPVDFIARLAALVPKPRVNLTRYHGVLAPNHRWRGMVTPAKRGKGVKRIANTEVRSPAERHVAMSWAQRLKRVFNIDIEVCGRCGGSAKVIALH